MRRKSKTIWIIEKLVEHLVEVKGSKKKRRKYVREPWDYEYTSEAAAYKKFNESYRNPGGPEKQDFFVVKVTEIDAPFRPAPRGWENEHR
jgi:hypothetical protein